MDVEICQGGKAAEGDQLTVADFSYKFKNFCPCRAPFPAFVSKWTLPLPLQPYGLKK